MLACLLTCHFFGSTIIGDKLSNLLSFAGHDILQLNHWANGAHSLAYDGGAPAREALSKETSQVVDLGGLVLPCKAAKQWFDVGWFWD